MSASLLVWLFGTGPNETGQMSFSELAASFTAKQMWQAKMQFCWQGFLIGSSFIESVFFSYNCQIHNATITKLVMIWQEKGTLLEDGCQRKAKTKTVGI